MKLVQVDNSLALVPAIALGAGVPGILLVRAWLRARNAGRDARLLSWATTLTWGLVLNVYTPFYDCILVVAACGLAASAVRSAFGSLRYRWLGGMFHLLYLTPWFSEICARAIHVQPYTLVLAAFGALTLVLLSDLHNKQSTSLPQSTH